MALACCLGCYLALGQMNLLVAQEHPHGAVDKTLLLAVEDAVEAQRYDQVLRLVPKGPQHPQLRLWHAQALAAVYGPEQAFSALRLPKPAVTFAMAEAWLADWPRSEHGQLASFIGDLSQQLKREDALIWWSLAIDVGGPRVDRNRLFLAVAEEAARQQRWDLVRSSAQALWSRRAQQEQRLRAGELLGLALVMLDRDLAFDHFVTLLAQRGLGDDQRTRVVIHIGQAWWREKPALVVRLSRESLANASLEESTRRSLVRWRALALAQLDPQSGLKALKGLPKEEQSRQVVAQELQRLEILQDAEGGIDDRRKRAEAAFGLGDTSRAERIIASLYQQDGPSLVLWLQLGERDLRALADLPSAQTLEGGFALAQRLGQAGDRRTAWLVLKPLLRRSGPNKRAELDRLGWALALSADQAPEQRNNLLKRARGYKERHATVGQAWAEYAIAQQDLLNGDELLGYWWRVIAYAPDNAPWLKIAIEQVLQISLAQVIPWQANEAVSQELQQRVANLAEIFDRTELADKQRFQWLMAQLLVQVHLHEEAVVRLRRLQAEVSAERAERIAEVLRQLAANSQ